MRIYLEKWLWGNSNLLHKHLHLFLFIFSGEERVPHEHFGHDAAETPHVDWHGVGQAKYDLRRAVEATLNIGVDPFVLETTGPKINYFDARFIRLLEEDILRLQITMYNSRLEQYF
jgi:hypothetical protein